MNNKSIVYFGKDLEAMSFAINYHKWILEEFRPYLGKNIVEVGAGTGSFSELLLQEKPETLTLVEPSEMFTCLQQNVSQIDTRTEIDLHEAIFAQVYENIAKSKRPDSIIYVNVLEHIDDDLAELQMIYQTLEKGGRCLIFVPALMSLYGEFDRKIGHFRRYARSEVEDKCQSAGFKILKSKYFDFAGIIPWYVKYKLFKSDSLQSGAVTLYDKLAIPIISKVESFVKAPIGKNLLIIGEKK